MTKPAYTPAEMREMAERAISAADDSGGSQAFHDTALMLRQGADALEQITAQQREIERLTADKDAPIHQRVWDLLRQMRHHLHEEDLISNAEYAWLLSEAPNVSGGGSPAQRRLETYDEHEARRREAEAALTEEREKVKALIDGIEKLRADAHDRNDASGFGRYRQQVDAYAEVLEFIDQLGIPTADATREG